MEHDPPPVDHDQVDLPIAKTRLAEARFASKTIWTFQAEFPADGVDG